MVFMDVLPNVEIPEPAQYIVDFTQYYVPGTVPHTFLEFIGQYQHDVGMFQPYVHAGM